jgi:methyl-accepting chemotaxis protein
MRIKSLQAKLFVGTGVVAAVALGIGGALVRSAWRERATADRFALLNELTTHLNAAAGYQALERGLGSVILSGDRVAADLLSRFNDTGRQSEQAVQAAENVLKRLQVVSRSDLVVKLQGEWSASLASFRAARDQVRSRSIPRERWVAAATETITREFRVRDAAFLPTNPSEQVLYYNTILRADVAALCEYAGRERAALGNQIAQGEAIDPALLAELAGYRGLVDHAIGRLLVLKEAASIPAELVAALSNFEREFLGAFEQVRRAVYEASAGGKPYPVSAGEWVQAATKAIDSALAIGPVATRLADEATAATSRAAGRAVGFSVSAMAIAALALAATLLFIARRVVRPIVRMMSSLSEAAVQVNSAATQVSASAQQAAEGSTEQASALEESSSALEQLAAMSANNAGNAAKANDLATAAREKAQASDQTIAQLNAAMTAINNSAGEIGKIIKVIQDIAFQTNLLALNAAVEAARAGEHGKGFAVVADEVRSLAQRCAAAARDTTRLIEDAVARAGEGSKATDVAGQTLQVIGADIAQMAGLLDGISRASSEQAEGVKQINIAVSQIDKVTQQNTACAEESAAASEELTGQAHALLGVTQELSVLVWGKAER